MAEAAFHDESLFAEPEEQILSPVDQLRSQWNQQPGMPLLKQKYVIDGHPELLPYAGAARLHGWSWPYGFAIKGMFLAAVLASLFNWFLTHKAGPLNDEIANMQANTQSEIQRDQGIIDATEAEIRRITKSPKQTFNLHMSETVLTREQALQQLNASLDDSRKSVAQFKKRMKEKETEMRATQNAQAIANSGTPLLFTLALILAAGGVRRGVQKDYPRGKHVRSAGDLYLYFATSEGVFFNLIFLAFLHFGLSGANYGMSDFFQRVGPLVWVFFWIAFYGLLLFYFVTVSRQMYQSIPLRSPSSDWGPENRILMRIHNNFLVTFALFEGTFLAACYLLYHADKRFF
jgi:hypothetical protein